MSPGTVAAAIYMYNGSCPSNSQVDTNDGVFDLVVLENMHKHLVVNVLKKRTKDSNGIHVQVISFIFHQAIFLEQYREYGILLQHTLSSIPSSSEFCTNS